MPDQVWSTFAAVECCPITRVVPREKIQYLSRLLASSAQVLNPESAHSVLRNEPFFPSNWQAH
jgi:hypothetical protein